MELSYTFCRNFTLGLAVRPKNILASLISAVGYAPPPGYWEPYFIIPIILDSQICSFVASAPANPLFQKMCCGISHLKPVYRWGCHFINYFFYIYNFPNDRDDFFMYNLTEVYDFFLISILFFKSLSLPNGHSVFPGQTPDNWR